jgi:hypothetical protein
MTDVHGNGEDFRRVRDVFLRAGGDAHLVVLGDIVHAPSEDARREKPALYDYPDESGAIAAGVAELAREAPGRVHFVLGNHDYGHIGGGRTSKFHRDEVEHLEARLAFEEREALHGLCARALLAIIAPCGVFMAHGSPDDTLSDLSELEDLALPPATTRGAVIVRSFVSLYGQPREKTERLLATVSRGAGVTVRMVVHGHDRSEEGFFVEGENQLCPVLFGAPREKKRLLVLDLAADYADVRALAGLRAAGAVPRGRDLVTATARGSAACDDPFEGALRDTVFSVRLPLSAAGD